MYQISYDGFCICGSVRKNNEDNIWCLDHSLSMVHEDVEEIPAGTVQVDQPAWFAVFDGMGGAKGGELASALAAERFGELVSASGVWTMPSATARRSGEAAPDLTAEPSFHLFSGTIGGCNRPENDFSMDHMQYTEYCRDMNQRILAEATQQNLRGMGSTVVGLSFHKEGISGFNLGDSRCYCLEDDKLILLSCDHTYQAGAFGRRYLVQCLGIPEYEFLLEPAVFRKDPEKGQQYLLCSDGLTDMLSCEKISSILRQDLPVTEKTRQLKENVLARGAEDNCTVLLIRVE